MMDEYMSMMMRMMGGMGGDGSAARDAAHGHGQ